MSILTQTLSSFFLPLTKTNNEFCSTPLFKNTTKHFYQSIHQSFFSFQKTQIHVEHELDTITSPNWKKDPIMLKEINTILNCPHFPKNISQTIRNDPESNFLLYTFSFFVKKREIRLSILFPFCISQQQQNIHNINEKKENALYENYNKKVNNEIYKHPLFFLKKELEKQNTQHSFFLLKKKVRKEIFKMVKKICMWLFVASSFANDECSQKMNIHMVLNDFLKFLPLSSSLKEKELKLENTSSAYTTSCKIETTIKIYRYEEWFKILIHETMHNMGLDFSNMNPSLLNSNIKQIFPLNHIQDLRIYESYCEIWAELINIFFYVYFTTSSKTTKTEFEKIFIKITKCVKIEREWALFQCVKVLRFYNMQYDDLFFSSKNTKFKELETHPFSYFVLKSLLFFKITDFISWCSSNNSPFLLKFNKTESNIISFCRFIQTHHKNQDYLSELQKYENFFEQHPVALDVVGTSNIQKKTLHFIFYSLRMSIFEEHNTTPPA